MIILHFLIHVYIPSSCTTLLYSCWKKFSINWYVTTSKILSSLKHTVWRRRENTPDKWGMQQWHTNNEMCINLNSSMISVFNLQQTMFCKKRKQLALQNWACTHCHEWSVPSMRVVQGYFRDAWLADFIFRESFEWLEQSMESDLGIRFPTKNYDLSFHDFSFFKHSF